MSKEPRLNYQAAATHTIQALIALSKASDSTLEPRLTELVRLRVSQINRCAFCLDMHSAALLRQGVDPRHLHTVAGWREADRFFSARERSALAWAEAVNAIPQRTPSDGEFAALREHFKDGEIAALTFVICSIRAFNMLNVSFCSPVPEKPYVSNA
jgi:AhpD family alkylhydroperoxidase